MQRLHGTVRQSMYANLDFWKIETFFFLLHGGMNGISVNCYILLVNLYLVGLKPPVIYYFDFFQDWIEIN